MATISTKIEKESEKKFILELLALYRSLTSLWDVDSPEYADRFKKEDQYEILLSKYRERYPNASKKQLCRKINSLRTNYRRQNKHLSKLQKNGAYAATIENTLWYYDALDFLADVRMPRKEQENKDTTTFEVTELNTEHEEMIDELPKRKKIRTDLNPTDEMIRLVTNRLKEPQNVFKRLGDIWATKLEEMERNQALIAEKLIHEIIFSGMMGQLDINTSVVHLNNQPNLDNSMEDTKPFMEYEVYAEP